MPNARVQRPARLYRAGALEQRVKRRTGRKPPHWETGKASADTMGENH